ncbi:MBL fold metallo-hydrolase [Robertkochia flava]|uniref:MBL fold metallo-hydrolase n=1 Tax=Robertkochia flava TaxID=3447986 RepID=UPI001CCFC4E2|nr:MBL fold metallo-hydrolase [Robertkochia marina]
MRIHHIRNATMIIETDTDRILVDPMLGPKGSLPAFTYFRFRARRNPIVDLPEHTGEVLKGITHCLITHRHPDHIDESGIAFLKKHKIPVTCSALDETFFKDKGLHIVQVLQYGQPTDFLGGSITGIPALHGYGYIAKRMGKVMGFFIKLPGAPSVYLSSDTVYTSDVDKVLKTLAPDLSVVACGSAQMDFFKPILMTSEDIVRFIRNAPGKVIANHLEAVNHCPTTREKLKEILKAKGLLEKTWIPADGEKMEM